jgi:hypothetical protein
MRKCILITDGKRTRRLPERSVSRNKQTAILGRRLSLGTQAKSQAANRWSRLWLWRWIWRSVFIASESRKVAEKSKKRSIVGAE